MRAYLDRAHVIESVVSAGSLPTPLVSPVLLALLSHHPVQDSGSNMISRTSWEQRHPLAIRAAHAIASSREGTSMIENPPMTDLVSGTGHR